MSAERPTFEAKPLPSSAGIPDVVWEKFKAEIPESIHWDRVESAMEVLKGEKIAVAPPIPEPEPTESQKFFRDMYRSGKLTPYQKDRPGISWEAIKMAWNDPQTQGETSKIMAVDLALRGGADKPYNQLGDLKTRATRAAVMVGNIVPNIAVDTLSSLIPNLIEMAMKNPLKEKLQIQNINAADERKKTLTEAKPQGEVSEATQKIIKSLNSKIGYINAGGKLFEVMNDKNVTAVGNTIMRTATGEKGWFTSEASDKLNDLLTYGFRDKIEDVSNGPTLESIFRIVYQIPWLGAIVEQVWTRWSNFQSSNEYSKGNLKAVYVAIGLAIGAYRDVDNLPNKSLSWKLTNKTYSGWTNFKKWLKR